MRTKEQIEQEVKKLEEIKPKVRQFSVFGDDNHAAIEVQIAVLKGELNENGIFNKYEDNDHLRDNGLEALAWMQEESEVESLAEEWATLT